MGFLDKLHFSKKPTFAAIEGYQDILERALEADDNYNLLLCGPPASSKTLFLMGILDIRKDAVYFDGSNTTSRILDVLEEKRPRIILIDEIDKLGKSWQNMLLNFMESGKVDVEQQKKQYHFKIDGAKVFATANDINRISNPLQSRFRKLFLPRYSETEFLNVAERVLPKLSPSIARYIGATVFKNGSDIRDVLSIGKLVRKDDGPNQIAEIISTMSKYQQGGQK